MAAVMQLNGCRWCCQNCYFRAAVGAQHQTPSAFDDSYEEGMRFSVLKIVGLTPLEKPRILTPSIIVHMSTNY